MKLLAEKYGEGVITLTLKDQYYNMREMVEPHPEVVEKAEERETDGRDACGASYPRRYRRFAALLHGIALPESFYGRNEFPR